MGASISTTFKHNLPTQSGKVVVITGCTSGTGLELAKISASKGADVVMLNRESSRSKEAFETVKAVCDESGASNDVKSIPFDLMDFESVKSGAEQVKAAYPDGIDVLCNNAGIMAFPNEATKDGYDSQMQVNHISHFLLTKELYPLLVKKADSTGDARIVNHSSVARKGSPLDKKYLDKIGGDPSLGDNTTGSRFERYHQSKLANCVFTSALADRLTAVNSKVKALVAHPGGCRTKLGSNMNSTGTDFSAKLMMPFVAAASQSIPDGTLGIAHCCFLDDVVNGQFYGPTGGITGEMSGKEVVIPLEDICTSDEAKKTLWEMSEAAVGAFDIY